MKKIVLLIFAFIFIFFISCNKKNNVKTNTEQQKKVFDPSFLKIKNPVKQVKGQSLYLPVYLTIPNKEGRHAFNLSGFVAIHNTDFKNDITISSVFFFDNDGAMVMDFLNGDIKKVKPLGTVNFFIPESIKSGIGSNFIIEWTSDSLVNEPLIESIMVSHLDGQGVSFLSYGKILNEIK